MSPSTGGRRCLWQLCTSLTKVLMALGSILASAKNCERSDFESNKTEHHTSASKLLGRRCDQLRQRMTSDGQHDR